MRAFVRAVLVGVVFAALHVPPVQSAAVTVTVTVSEVNTETEPRLDPAASSVKKLACVLLVKSSPSSNPGWPYPVQWCRWRLHWRADYGFGGGGGSFQSHCDDIRRRLGRLLTTSLLRRDEHEECRESGENSEETHVDGLVRLLVGDWM